MASFDEVIPPGEAGYVTAKLTTDKLRGKVGRGITVYTNDPAAGRVLLTVRAEVLTSVSVLPHETLILTNTPGPQARPSVLVRKEAGEPGELSIDGIETSAPWIVATATRIDEARPAGGGLPSAQPGDWLVEVATEGAEEFGNSQESVRLRTGLERQPELILPIIVRLRPPVHVDPAKLELPAPQNGEPSQGTLLVAVRRGLDAAELEAEATADGLQVELESTGGRFYKAHVSWSGQDLAGGAVVFKIGSERYRVPVVAAAAGS